MITKARKLGTAVLLSCIMIVLGTMTAQGGTPAGHDWYCPDPEAHAQYEKHRQQYHDHNADSIIEILNKLFSDQTLTLEEKKTQAAGILADYAAKVKMGIGD